MKNEMLEAAATRHVAPAVSGFFRSMLWWLTPVMGGALQDILRLLTLWFNYGHCRSKALVEGFGHALLTRGFQ